MWQIPQAGCGAVHGAFCPHRCTSNYGCIAPRPSSKTLSRGLPLEARPCSLCCPRLGSCASKSAAFWEKITRVGLAAAPVSSKREPQVDAPHTRDRRGGGLCGHWIRAANSAHRQRAPAVLAPAMVNMEQAGMKIAFRAGAAPEGLRTPGGVLKKNLKQGHQNRHDF